MSYNKLIDFWRKAPLDTAPYLHPHDDIPGSKIQQGVNSYTDFVSNLSRQSLSRFAFHLSLLPQPYLGDLENAKIIILLANPGLHAADYHLEENHPDFREALISTIRQERRDHIFLNPKWAWTSGFSWWEGKLRKVAEILAQKYFEGVYGKALADLAKKIAVIELVPYHSFSFPAGKKNPSTVAAIEFVNSIPSDQTIVVTRRVKEWGLPNAPNIVKYSAGQARNASLGPNSPGGKAILSVYKKMFEKHAVQRFRIFRG